MSNVKVGDILYSPTDGYDAMDGGYYKKRIIKVINLIEGLVEAYPR